MLAFLVCLPAHAAYAALSQPLQKDSHSSRPLEEGGPPARLGEKHAKLFPKGMSGKYSVEDHIFDISSKAVNSQNIGLVYSEE